jgi:hypothetical protein
MGGSHAGRLASCLDDLKLSVADLSTPGWKITEEAVDILIEQLQKVLKEEPDTTCILVLQAFDSSVYFGTGTNGEKVAAIKAGGRYHIPGDMQCVDRDGFKELFNILTPLLRAGGECRKVILTPLILYPTKPCCEDSGHLTNFRNRVSMRTMLTESEEWSRNMAYFQRIREFTILTPHELLSDAGEEESTKTSSRRLASYWNDDPVHMCTVGYAVMARQLAIKIAATGGPKHVKSGGCAANSSAATPGGKAGSGRRPSWVSTDEAVANRSDSVWGRGRGNSHSINQL